MDHRIYISAELNLIKNGMSFRRIFQLPIAKGGTLGGQSPGNGTELRNWGPAIGQCGPATGMEKKNRHMFDDFHV